MLGTDTLTRSAPAASIDWICATVASTSQVSVLVILCTAIGASPPIGTLPTWICLLWRRFIGEGWFMATVLPCTASSRALVIDSDAPATLCIRLKPDTDCAMPTHDYPARLDHLLDRRFVNQVVAPAAIAVEDRPTGPMIPLGFVSITRFESKRTHL